ncbi:uncharacterized protein FIBRA_02794 [Fibroporia radiculosa]|uniref:Uncharacterized protein n=1 Tax=Fibroporia radiculosa TaxID=599839 RepID=J4H219_9APHY|nr:uncharacterized protein FIBRA_02794 [Fibroporia radiculosa]CCM00754.1 predicted protein [Fibroporia radiculosa]
MEDGNDKPNNQRNNNNRRRRLPSKLRRIEDQSGFLHNGERWGSTPQAYGSAEASQASSSTLADGSSVARGRRRGRGRRSTTTASEHDARHSQSPMESTTIPPSYHEWQAEASTSSAGMGVFAIGPSSYASSSLPARSPRRGLSSHGDSPVEYLSDPGTPWTTCPAPYYDDPGQGLYGTTLAGRTTATPAGTRSRSYSSSREGQENQGSATRQAEAPPVDAPRAWAIHPRHHPSHTTRPPSTRHPGSTSLISTGANDYSVLGGGVDTSSYGPPRSAEPSPGLDAHTFRGHGRVSPAPAAARARDREFEDAYVMFQRQQAAYAVAQGLVSSDDEYWGQWLPGHSPSLPHAFR